MFYLAYCVFNGVCVVCLGFFNGYAQRVFLNGGVVQCGVE